MDSSDTAQLLEQAQKFLSSQDQTALQGQISVLEQASYAPDFWQKPDAQDQMQTLSQLKAQFQEFQTLADQIDSLQTALFLLEEEPDNPEYQTQVPILAGQLAAHLKDLQLQAYLAGPYDSKGVLFSLHSGQGGTEAMDWAQMLQRLYERFFQRRGWKYTLLDESPGEEAGIKSATYEVNAPLAYGYLKHERGAHRLVRLSPFNADSLRQTSFALVEVLPLISETDTQVQINPSDLEWHYSRAGGPGGQNVNKVNSAVELHYAPLDLTVRCREERSQEQNRQRALQILRAQIARQQEEQLSQELAATKGEFRQASWGNQIRNYVLHPYQLVKDTRTNVETNDTGAVLDGDIDLFINAEIEQLT